MKKFISFFTIALFLCLCMNSYAQVATNYTWSQAAGTYTPITGGTILGTATGPGIGTPSLDDEVYTLPGGTIPFTFNYDGGSYTGLFVSSNGYITFDAAPAPGNYTPISNSTTGYKCISAFGGDLNSLFNINGNTGEIRYETVGSEFVIQWSHFRPYSTSTSTTTYWNWNFQIRLHSDGTVRIVYDAGFLGTPSSSSRQVGLRGPNNTFATNVNNRIVTSVTTWAASIPGTSNSSTCALSTTNIPASGRTFIWSPPIVVANDVGVSAAFFGNPLAIISAGKGYDLTATVKNFGTTTQNVVPVYYTVNGGSAIGPVSTVGPIVQFATENVVFNGGNAFTPLTAGVYTLKVYTALGGDGSAVNDTTTLVVNVLDKISTFPYTQTFTVPTGWTTFGGATWGIGSATNPDGVALDAAAIANFYSIGSGVSLTLRSPEMDFTGISNPVLDFYVAYRTYTGLETDTIKVMVSTDGGVTFSPASTPYVKTWDTDPSLATLMPASAGFVPAASTEWRHETVDLSNVGNMGNVVIGFVGVSKFGNNAWIDNVIVSAPNSLCTDAVTGPGTYNCNSLVTLDFTATPVPPSNGNQSSVNVKKIEKAEFESDNKIPSYYGNAVFNSFNVTDNPNGGTAFISQYTNNDPGQTIAANGGATTGDGDIFTPSFAYHDYWFTVTYDGNDLSGYATYDITIDLDGLVFSDPLKLYVMKRADNTGAWVCQNTSVVGNALKVSGLTDFSDFAIGGSEALPVELSSFVSATNGSNVTLNWTTASETNNSGFDIERSSVAGTWSKVGNVTGNGTSTSSNSYSFTDRNLASGNYSYRLKQIDFNGNFEYFNLSSEVIVGIPVKYDLSQNYPNPFNPSTKINYALPTDGQVSIKIFDMSGKEVMSLVNEVKTAGYYSVNFNASNLSSGIYFYKLSTADFTATKKMMLVK